MNPFCFRKEGQGISFYCFSSSLGRFTFLHDFKASANANLNFGIPHTFLIFLDTFDTFLKNANALKIISFFKCQSNK